MTVQKLEETKLQKSTKGEPCMASPPLLHHFSISPSTHAHTILLLAGQQMTIEFAPHSSLHHMNYSTIHEKVLQTEEHATSILMHVFLYWQQNQYNSYWLQNMPSLTKLVLTGQLLYHTGRKEMH